MYKNEAPAQESGGLVDPVPAGMGSGPTARSPMPERYWTVIVPFIPIARWGVQW